MSKAAPASSIDMFAAPSIAGIRPNGSPIAFGAARSTSVGDVDIMEPGAESGYDSEKESDSERAMPGRTQKGTPVPRFALSGVFPAAAGKHASLNLNGASSPDASMMHGLGSPALGGSAARAKKHAEVAAPDPDNFDALLHEMALLHTTEEEKEEKCPICSAVLKLSAFAPHVYNCLDKLDRESKAKQEADDRAVALRIAQEMGSFGVGWNAGPYSAPAVGAFGAGDMELDSEMTDSSAAFDAGAALGHGSSFMGSYAMYDNPQLTRHTLPACERGSSCDSAAMPHFQDFVHPNGHVRAIANFDTHPDCLMCGRRVELAYLEYHVNMCLEAAERSNPARSTASAAAPSAASAAAAAFGGSPSSAAGSRPAKPVRHKSARMKQVSFSHPVAVDGAAAGSASAGLPGGSAAAGAMSEFKQGAFSTCYRRSSLL